MISPVSTLLIAAHALVTISTAQAVGKFVHEASYFTATYDVNEERQAMLTIVLKNWQINGQVVKFPGPNKFTSRFFPLRELGKSTYTVDSRKGGHTGDSNGLDESIRDVLVISGATVGYPLGPQDFTTIVYSSADTFTTTFGTEVLTFTREAYDLVPGDFVYKDPVAPHLEMKYHIRPDGLVGIQIECGKHRTIHEPFKLTPRYYTDSRRVRYAVEPVSRVTLDKFLRKARRVCPSKFSTPTALSQVVFATEKTIFVPFEGSTLALTKD
ncbi:hypothetical protein FOZ60_014079 [Perkinsus olseni]|uniref:Uncharacterized protein n=1 Tax=Perkinsus olseni TaxID=32597 RepID=A0A7J6P8Q3_PEROL|nr:hypothetical protein FOZ60_014079 [Perkinsus olseni]